MKYDKVELLNDDDQIKRCYETWYDSDGKSSVEITSDLDYAKTLVYLLASRLKAYQVALADEQEKNKQGRNHKDEDLISLILEEFEICHECILPELMDTDNFTELDIEMAKQLLNEVTITIGGTTKDFYLRSF